MLKELFLGELQGLAAGPSGGALFKVGRERSQDAKLKLQESIDLQVGITVF